MKMMHYNIGHQYYFHDIKEFQLSPTANLRVQSRLTAGLGSFHPTDQFKVKLF
jgi:hypothetical protein